MGVTSGAQSKTYNCMGNPAQVTVDVFTNATCTTAHTTSPRMKIALDTCMIDEDSTAHNSGATPYYTWSIHSPQNQYPWATYRKQSYPDETCTGSDETPCAQGQGQGCFENDPAKCGMADDFYIKFVTARIPAANANAPSPSSTDTSNTTSAPKATTSKSVQNHGRLLIAMLAVLKAVV